MAEDCSASIVIPTYNRPNLLPHAVASALKALPPDDEIVVTDDGDAPASDTLAEVDHPSLVVTRNTGASGAAANRNHGVRMARGRIVFFLDDDDLMYPGYVSRVLKALEIRPDQTWGFSATAGHTDPATDLVAPPDADDWVLKDNAPFRQRIAGLGCGLWVRRDAFLDLGGIHEDLSINEDTDFSLTLLSDGHSPLYTSQPGVSLYRRRRPSLTTLSAASERARCLDLIMQRHRGFLQDHPDGLGYLLRRYLKYSARARDAKQGLRAALTTGPTLQRSANTLMFGAHYLSSFLRSN